MYIEAKIITTPAIKTANPNIRLKFIIHLYFFISL
jgi:hypothetical protein